MTSQNRRAPALAALPASSGVTLSASTSLDLLDQANHIRRMLGGIQMACEAVGDNQGRNLVALVSETENLMDQLRTDLHQAFGKEL